MDRSSPSNFSITDGGSNPEIHVVYNYADDEPTDFSRFHSNGAPPYKIDATMTDRDTGSPGYIPLKRSSRVFSLNLNNDGLIPLIPGSDPPSRGMGISPVRQGQVDGDSDNGGGNDAMGHVNVNDGLNGTVDSYSPGFDGNAFVPNLPSPPAHDLELEPEDIEESPFPPTDKHTSYSENDDELMDDKPAEIIMKSAHELPVPDPTYVFQTYPQEFHGLVVHRYKKDCRTWLWKSIAQRQARLEEQQVQTLDRNLGNTLMIPPEESDTNSIIENIMSFSLGPK